MIQTVLLSLCVFVPQDPPPTGAGAAQAPQPMPIPRAVVLRLAEDQRIVVDGGLDEWPGLPPLGLDDIRQLSGTALGAYRGNPDLTGRFFLAWDEEHLFLSGQVLDDWHIRLAKDTPRLSEIPPADNLVITLDPNRDTQAIGPDPGRADDVSFWIAEVDGQDRRVVLWDRYRGTARFAEGAAAVVRRDEDRGVTLYEARLPWREILATGARPEADLVLDAQFELSDYDDPTDPLAQTRAGWTFGMGIRIDPGLYGSIVLTDRRAGSVDKIEGVRVAAVTKNEPDELLDEAAWLDLAKRVRASEPARVTIDAIDPAFAGGDERNALLREYERHVARYPRVDYLEMQHRIHRRMYRECEGIIASGLPYYWDHVLDRLARDVAKPLPESGFRLHRLPQGGWLVRSRVANFVIDPAGYALEKKLWQTIDFGLLTRPMEVGERNDQLFLRMTAVKPKRPVLTHLALALPGVSFKEFPLVLPGQTYEPNGLKVRVLGNVSDDGLVSASVGYEVIWPDGTTLVVSGSELFSEHVEGAGGIDLLILSAEHPAGRVCAQRLGSRLTVLDDVLECADVPGANGRVPLTDVFALQAGVLPHPSTLLLPGESIDVRRGR